jgi:hypothetical protein
VPAVAPVDARHALLGGLIDHAPMFPPAELPLDEALADHAAARAGETAWMVHRFVVRASRFAELPLDEPPRLSVVLDTDWHEFAAASGDDPRVEAFELMPAEARQLEGLIGYELFAEVPAGRDFDTRGMHPKVRCGGAAVPSAADLAEFVRECKRHLLPFKATAGLHHAVRTETEHGLCNLLAAVLFDDEEAALAETDGRAFWITNDAFGWRDGAAGTAEITRARSTLLLSVGSCSFIDPVDDLRAIGLL